MAPSDRVDASAGAVVHLDGRPLGLLGGLPGDADEQVDANVHWHHVRDAVPLAMESPHDSLSSSSNYPTGAVEVVHPAWVGLLQAGRHYARSHDCHRQFCSLKPCHLFGKCDDSEDPGNVHPDRLGEVFVEADGCRTVEHYVHRLSEDFLLILTKSESILGDITAHRNYPAQSLLLLLPDPVEDLGAK